MNCTKAIFPVAGYGTRRLPIAKAVEKCMLPLLNRPVVDYAVEDCIAAGITDIYFVVSGDARQLRDYYESQPTLEDYLRRKGKDDMLAQIQPPQGVQFHYISQDLADGRYGTSVPVWLCRDYIEPGESVAVVMGDQVLYRTDGGSEIRDMIEAVDAAQADAGIVGVPVPREQIGMFGIIEMDEAGHYERIIEHPKPEDTTSDLNNASLYVVPYEFFDVLDAQIRAERTQKGEYFLPYAINDFVESGHTVQVVRSKGEYLECGSLENWVHANSWLLEHGR